MVRAFPAIQVDDDDDDVVPSCSRFPMPLMLSCVCLVCQQAVSAQEIRETETRSGCDVIVLAVQTERHGGLKACRLMKKRSIKYVNVM